MIHASFDDKSHKSAAIAGIYQYDTGQRLKMHGLPSPKELAERDDFLSGDAVTVQAQYGFVGDSQTAVSYTHLLTAQSERCELQLRQRDFSICNLSLIHIFFISRGS